MDNERVNTPTAAESGEDLFLAFAGAFERNMRTVASEEQKEKQLDSVMSVGNRTQATQAAFEAPVRITEEDNEAAAQATSEEATAQQDELTYAEKTETESESKTESESVSEDKAATEEEPAPKAIREPTEKEQQKAAKAAEKQQKKDEKNAVKQQKKAEKTAKKDAKWDKKDAKRKAKVERQQKNNTKIMLGGAVFLGIICAALLFMNHFDLSFMDIPDVLSGEKSLSQTSTTMPLAIHEQTEAGPTAPSKGNYIVTADDGVYMRESASSAASRVAVLSEGTRLSVSAFKYDSENECFWGRTGINGNYGWVIMTALTKDETPTEPATQATTIESLG